MEIDKIRARIKKLLALSKSPNENEAMAALEKANDLLREMGLTEGDVLYVKDSIKGTKRDCPWRMTVLGSIGWLNGCVCGFNKYTGMYYFLGPELPVLMSKEMYLYITRSIDRIATQHIRKNASAGYRRSFKYGAAININSRIHAMAERAMWFDRDVQRKAIEKWSGLEISDHTIGEEKNSRVLTKGYVAGSKIGLNRQTTGTAPAMIE